MDDYIPFELLPKNRQQKKDSKIAYRHCFEVRPTMLSFKGDAEDNRLRRIFERDLIYVNPLDFLPKELPKPVHPVIVNYENVDIPHFFVGEEFKSFQLKCFPINDTRWFAECTEFGLILKSKEAYFWKMYGLVWWFVSAGKDHPYQNIHKEL